MNQLWKYFYAKVSYYFVYEILAIQLVNLLLNVKQVCLPCEHIKCKLVGRRINVFEREEEAGQRLRVRDNVVLQQLVKEEEWFLPDQQVDQKLVEEMLKRICSLKQMILFILPSRDWMSMFGFQISLSNNKPRCLSILYNFE